jgi:hypothetical protein
MQSGLFPVIYSTRGADIQAINDQLVPFEVNEVISIQ